MNGNYKMIIGMPVDIGNKLSINKVYADYLTSANFSVIGIYPQDNLYKITGLCDGLLLPGGVDIDPIFYGEDNERSLAVNPERDKLERELLALFVEADKPILGICRGFQLIAREYLSSIPEKNTNLLFSQHVNNHSLVDELSIKRHVLSHLVRGQKCLISGDINDIQQISFPVNSMHHQCLLMNTSYRITVQPALDKKGKWPTLKGINILAGTNRGISDKNRKDWIIVEAFSLHNLAGILKILCVQWHPEEINNYALLQLCFGRDNIGIVDDEVYKSLYRREY